MIKVTCDMCGKPIDYNIDGVNCSFINYGTVKFKTNWEADKQFCIACATRVCNWIDEQSRKIKNEMKPTEAGDG